MTDHNKVYLTNQSVELITSVSTIEPQISLDGQIQHHIEISNVKSHNTPKIKFPTNSGVDLQFQDLICFSPSDSFVSVRAFEDDRQSQPRRDTCYNNISIFRIFLTLLKFTRVVWVCTDQKTAYLKRSRQLNCAKEIIIELHGSIYFDLWI